VRIIAGEFKGRRLKTPSWTDLRPTSDKLRETLFNILAPRVHGARVLDGYAGTGAVGIEAISRGAAHVTFIERDRRAMSLVQSNLAVCGVERGYTIHRGDAALVLRRLPAGTAFDLIFLDPPYFSHSKKMEGVLDIQRDHAALIRQCAALLAPGGTLYFSTNRRGFKLDAAVATELNVQDITPQTLDEDFKRPPPTHRCWRIARSI